MFLDPGVSGEWWGKAGLMVRGGWGRAQMASGGMGSQCPVLTGVWGHESPPSHFLVHRWRHPKWGHQKASP